MADMPASGSVRIRHGWTGENWKEFCEYEKEVNDSIVDTPMLALCTYPLPGSAAAEILDVTRTHQFALARRNKEWEVVETSELKQAKAEILRLNNDFGAARSASGRAS